MNVSERDRTQQRYRYPSINALSTKLSSYAKFDEKQLVNGAVNKSREMPKKKTFPKELKIFLQYIHGNGVCPDCEVRLCENGAPRAFQAGLPIRETNLTWAK